jgi:hypothetical protein
MYCGDADMTEEHIVADWVLRAFARSRRPSPGFNGSFVGPAEMKMQVGEALPTAEIVCRRCNNEWMSAIDQAAAHALKPLIKGRTTVELDPAAQSAIAAWIFKSTLTFDAIEHADAGRLASLRKEFASTKLAPPGTHICVGPAPPIPFGVEGVREAAGLALFGVRTTPGVVNVRLEAKNADGTPGGTLQTAVPSPGRTVMLGRINAIISGRRAPIVPTPEWNFRTIWPTSPESVRMTSEPRATKAAAISGSDVWRHVSAQRLAARDTSAHARRASRRRSLGHERTELD